LVGGIIVEIQKKVPDMQNAGLTLGQAFSKALILALDEGKPAIMAKIDQVGNDIGTRLAGALDFGHALVGVGTKWTGPFNTELTLGQTAIGASLSKMGTELKAQAASAFDFGQQPYTIGIGNIARFAQGMVAAVPVAKKATTVIGGGLAASLLNSLQAPTSPTSAEGKGFFEDITNNISKGLVDSGTNIAKNVKESMSSVFNDIGKALGTNLGDAAAKSTIEAIQAGLTGANMLPAGSTPTNPQGRIGVANPIPAIHPGMLPVPVPRVAVMNPINTNQSKAGEPIYIEPGATSVYTSGPNVTIAPGAVQVQVTNTTPGATGDEWGQAMLDTLTNTLNGLSSDVTTQTSAP
jgi:hypothetical protein